MKKVKSITFILLSLAISFVVCIVLSTLILLSNTIASLQTYAFLDSAHAILAILQTPLLFFFLSSVFYYSKLIFLKKSKLSPSKNIIITRIVSALFAALLLLISVGGMSYISFIQHTDQSLNLQNNLFLKSIYQVQTDFEKHDVSATDIYVFYHFFVYLGMVISSVSVLKNVFKTNPVRTPPPPVFPVYTASDYEKMIGFDYEQSEFYVQTKIPFFQLKQANGRRGEFEAYKILKNANIPNAHYVFNREIPKADGLLTEIDLILITDKALFVIENKDYSTKIYGKASDYDLTIIDHSGKKHSIYNPIRQNEKHVQSLKNYLKAQHLYQDTSSFRIFSVVVFSDYSSNKSDDIISGIDIDIDTTTVCTSQNLPHIIKTLNSSQEKNIDAFSIYQNLLALSIRK